MAAMVLVRVMEGEGDGAAEVVGRERKGRRKRLFSFLPIAYTYLPRYLSQEHKTCLLCQRSVFVAV